MSVSGNELLLFLIKVEQFDDNDGTHIRIWAKDRDSRDYIIIVPFKPYLYIRGHVKPDRFPKDIADNIVNYEFSRKKVYDADVEIPVTKLFIKSTKRFKFVRERLVEEGYDIFESEIPFESRFMMDARIKFWKWAKVKCRPAGTRGKFEVVKVSSIEDIQPLPEDEARELGTPKIKYLFFDIEVYNKETMSIGRAPIIAIGVYATDYSGREEVLLFNQRDLGNEENVLREFVKFFERYDPDVVIGYNSNNYDVPFINERLKKYNLSIKWSRLPPYDYLPVRSVIRHDKGSTPVYNPNMRLLLDLFPVAVLQLVGLSRYSLKDVAEKLGVLPKEERVIIEGSRLWEYWDNNPDYVLEYLRDDVVATKLVWDELKDNLFELMDELHVDLFQMASATSSTIVETAIMEDGNANGYIFPSKVYIPLRVLYSVLLEENIPVNPRRIKKNATFLSDAIYTYVQEYSKKCSTKKKFDNNRGICAKFHSQYLPRIQAILGVDDITVFRILQKVKERYSSYTGAIVLEPERGVSIGVSAGDFRSLYPSVIMSNNISPDTFITRIPAKRMYRILGYKFRNMLELLVFAKKAKEYGLSIIPNIDIGIRSAIEQILSKKRMSTKDKVTNIRYLLSARGIDPDDFTDEELLHLTDLIEKEPHRFITDFYIFKADPTFVTKEEFGKRFGVKKGNVSRSITALFEKRIHYKKLMKTTHDPTLKKIYDIKQSSLKVLINSFYGFFGYIKALLFRIELAASITAGGRFITFSTLELFRLAGFEKVYGDTDSIFGQIPDSIIDRFVETLSLDTVDEYVKRIDSIEDIKIDADMDAFFEYIDNVLAERQKMKEKGELLVLL